MRCPILQWNNTACVKEECAWWISNGVNGTNESIGPSGRCAIAQLAIDINNIKWLLDK